MMLLYLILLINLDMGFIMYDNKEIFSLLENMFIYNINN